MVLYGICVGVSMSTETKALAQAKMIGKIKSLPSWIVVDGSQYQGLN